MDETLNGCHTTPKQRGGITGKGFVKGDPRINRKGRPKSFDEVRSLAVELAHEDTETRRIAVEKILRSWRDSKDLNAQVKFIEYAFGKVPDKIEATHTQKPVLILHHGHERNGNSAN